MKQLFVIICTFLISFSAWSQAGSRDRSRDIGIFGGTAYYLGELNRNHYGGELTPGGGAFYRQNINTRWSFNFAVSYFEISAFDSDSTDPWTNNRNLHFKTPIIEGSATAELNFFPYKVGSQTDRFTPYLFLGLAYYKMNPQAEYNGFWYELQPLRTEGQGTSENPESPYNLNGLSLPYGFGLKAALTNRISVNISYGMRSAATDYLDDVSTQYVSPAVLVSEVGTLSTILADRSELQLSNNNANVQRGDPTNNDFYAFTTFALSIKIDKKKTSCWKGL